MFNDPGFISKPTGPIKTDHWNRKWIPFTCDDTGDFLCIDLDPPKGGKKGQIIFWWHEVGAVTVVADGFRELICRLADDLESGVYTYTKKGFLYPRGKDSLTFDELLKTFSRKPT